MAIRVVLSAVLSALAMFFWGFVFWGPVIDATSKLMAPLPPEAERDVLPPLRAARTPDGMYVYPGPLADQNDEAARTAWETKVAEGPILHMAYRSQGTSPMDPAMFAKGLAHSFVIALAAGAALALAVNGLPSYARRVGLLALVSFVAAIWTNVGNVIWWFHTPRYGAGQVIYTLVGGLLMALISAAIIKPRAAATVTRSAA
jgi:hypothetical protein